MERAISAQMLIDASLDEVWAAWTTEAGIVSFFAPACRIDLKPDGAYEIYFDPSAPPGERGSEGMRLLALQPKTMLSFTWNAPLSLPQAREQRTHVVIRCQEVNARQTRVALTHDGWGEGGEWDQAYEYFERAWKKIVLPRLQHRFKYGPVDWENPSGADALSEIVV